MLKGIKFLSAYYNSQILDVLVVNDVIAKMRNKKPSEFAKIADPLGSFLLCTKMTALFILSAVSHII